MKSLLLASTFVVALLLFGCVAANASTNNSANPLGQNASGAVSASPSSIATSSSALVKAGDHVAVDYIGTLDNNSVFDTSIESVARTSGLFNAQRSYAPLEFTVGAGQMIKGFDQGVVGMKVGDTKIIHLAPKDAYGERDPSAVQQVPVSDLTAAGIHPRVGESLSTVGGAQGTITALNTTTATIDFNPPLAGLDLNFAITLKAIK